MLKRKKKKLKARKAERLIPHPATPSPREAEMIHDFWELFYPTLGDTVAKVIDMPRHFACFQICRVVQELSPMPARLVPGILVMNDNHASPLVVGHCMVEIVNGLLLDFSFTGPESYGLDKDTTYEFHPWPAEGFELPPHVTENISNGLSKAEAWWDDVDHKAILLAVEIAANGGRVVVG